MRNPYTTLTPETHSGLDFVELYNIVLKAQKAALSLVRDGVAAKELDLAARRVLESARLKGHPSLNLADHFTHGLGHGIGLDIHELPRVRRNSDDILRAGMVITLEPGVYIKGWGGIRIEDDILVRNDDGLCLTSVPHDPDILKSI